ncbi:hypothetical protein LCGC14_1882750 [marine sediment metagenome]|uniref:Uncharacterized protein n=1 Tax=marine sediment metagenome TaxID=412755 RepID=A0A0F9G1P0_9ZZZZ
MGDKNQGDVLALLQERFPHGDPLFLELTLAELDGYSAKNYDYAAGGEDPNGNFNRIAQILRLYPGLNIADPRMIAILYAFKQLDQVLWSLSRGFEGRIEGIDERLTDIHVYIKIARAINAHMKEAGTARSEG